MIATELTRVQVGTDLTPILEARRRRARGFLITLALGLMAVVVLSAGMGALRIAPLQVVAVLAEKIGLHLNVPFEPQQAAVLLSVRLPRILFAVLFGAGLAVAGAAIQGLFRNPLADPVAIGVSSGAALGAVATIVAGGAVIHWLPAPLRPAMIPLAAFVGGIVATLLVNRFAQTDGRASISALLLAGVAMNAFAGAGTGLFTSISNDAQLRSITFWMLGSLGSASWSTLAFAAPAVLLGIGGLLLCARVLNALLLGESEAGHLGFSIEHAKRIVIILSALLVGVSVAFAGIIGFVGLVIPHLVRLTIGPDHRGLLPACALLGAALLTLADLLCRTVAAPAEIPIGIVTALLGAPFFFWLLRREGGRL